VVVIDCRLSYGTRKAFSIFRFNRVVLKIVRSFPAWPNNQTFWGFAGTFQMCHERTCPRGIRAQAVKRTGAESYFGAGASPRLFLPCSDIFVLSFPRLDASLVLVG
jgi:hypothetical protein